MRYRLDIAFHGAEFHGWQRQSELRTVQGELELWLSRLLGMAEGIAVTGAGRTDAGVHASGMVAHFDVDREIDCEQLALRLHAALPPDLVVNRVSPVGPGFHARYSAIARYYQYRMTTARTPFNRDCIWHVPGPLDLAAMHEAAAAILGSHDFSGFCVAASRKEENSCDVSRSEWEVQDSLLIYHVRADRFLHMMVRLLVGTMVDIGRGRWTPGEIGAILAGGDVRRCGTAAPPEGLTLVQVEYPDGL